MTISYNVGPGNHTRPGNDAVEGSIADMHCRYLHAEFAGDAANADESSGNQPLLIVAALLAVYIVLGILMKVWFR